MQILSEGQCIKHVQYGFGIVTESDVERTSIDFDSVGMKKFVTTLMTMELVGEAPERPTKPGAAARRRPLQQPRALQPAARASSRPDKIFPGLGLCVGLLKRLGVSLRRGVCGCRSLSD